MQDDNTFVEYLISYYILHNLPCYFTISNKELKQKSQKFYKNEIMKLSSNVLPKPYNASCFKYLSNAENYRCFTIAKTMS